MKMPFCYICPRPTAKSDLENAMRNRLRVIPKTLLTSHTRKGS